MKISVTVNGIVRTFDVPPATRLMDALREAGYFSVKRGCDYRGECGNCAVILNGTPVNSCQVFAAQTDGAEVVTVEGLGNPKSLHPLQAAFLDEAAVQCGYCTPAMILVAKHLLDHNPRPSEAEVREALAGILCRCTGYTKPIKAVLTAAERLAAG